MQLFLQNAPDQLFQKVMIMALIKVNKILLHCHFTHKKLGLQSLQISSTFKFSFMFKLLPYTEALLTKNSIHVPLISH